MNSPLIIRPEAEQELAEARDWYEAQRNGLGDDFLAAIDPVFDQIRANPELYAPQYKSVRRVSLRRFPYVVYYRIVTGNVEVIAVLHGSRHPRHWRSRA